MNGLQWLLVIVLCISLGRLVWSLVRSQIRLYRMREHGRRVIAKITKVERTSSTNRHGGEYYACYLHAEWTDSKTGLTHTFIGGSMHDSSRYQVGEIVPVLIDPNNPNRYALDG